MSRKLLFGRDLSSAFFELMSRQLDDVATFTDVATTE